ncbi:MAG TPA: FHA domain-containing protein [Tepidisphaeraceae bacterium]|jgi:pSer/pThr/pTyr-binding forkhead associated (FHA) protein
MADSPSSPKNTTAAATAAKQPALLPQGEHAGKSAMPVGTRQLTLVGSRNRSHLHLLSTTISRNHACIVMTKAGPYIRDLASRTGVILNGRKVKESDLHDGDVLQVGSFKFKFQDPGGSIRLPAAPRPPLAMLEMGGRSMTALDERTVLIGRRPGCDITLDSPAVSNTHAVIFECDGKRYVRDLGSRTGTQVNGTTVHQQVLELGDQINVGGTTFRYMAADMPLGDEDLSDARLPLAAELERPAAAPEHGTAEDLEFAELEHAAVHTPPPLSHVEEEAIPLVHDEPPIVPADEAVRHDAGPIPLDEEIHPAAEDEQAPFATTEDLGLDSWATEEERPADAPTPDEGPASLDFVSEAAAGPVAEPITELSSIGFPLVEPDDEFRAAPIGLIQPIDAAAEPIELEAAPEPAIAEAAAPQTEPEPIAVEPEPIPSAEAPADAEVAPTIEPPSEATLATVLPPAEPEVVSAAEETPVESTEPILVEPETSSMQIEEALAVNAAPEPTPEPVSDEMPAAVAPADELPEPVAAEPEMAPPEAPPAPVATASVEIEPEPVSEHLEEALTQPAAEVAEAPAEPVAHEAEPEPVVSATEPTRADSGVTVGAGEAAQIVEVSDVPSEPAVAAEPLFGGSEAATETAAEPAVSPAPLRVEEVDLSAVQFEAEATEPEAAAEADEPAAGPAPLLDLAGEESQTQAAIEAVDAGEVADVAAPEKGRPKSRAAKKKRARARRKKGEPTTAGTGLTGASVIAADAAAVAGLAAESAPAAVEVGAEGLATGAETATDDAEIMGEQPEPQPVDAAEVADLPVADAGATHTAPTEPSAEPVGEGEGVGYTRILATETGSEPLGSHAGEVEHLAPEESERIAAEGVHEPEAVSEGPREESSDLEGPSLAKPHAADAGDVVGITGDVGAVEPVAGALTWAEATAETARSIEVAAPGALDQPPEVSAPPVETIDQTEPTLESALALEPALDEGHQPVVEGSEFAEPSGPADNSALSDTAFGVAVRDFMGPDLGPLVEEAPAASPVPASHETAEADAAAPPAPIEPELLAHEPAPLLELEPDLAIGRDEKSTAQAQAGAHEVAADDELNLADLDAAHETPQIASPGASEEPLELGAGTELHLDLPADLGPDALPEPALEFGDPEDIDDELPPLELDDAGSLGLEESHSFAKPQAAETLAPADLRPSMDDEVPSHTPVSVETPDVAPEPAVVPPPVESAAPARAAVPPSTAAPTEPSATPGPRLDPFFGMQRDMGSFIGGLPLALKTPPPATAGAAATATPPARPVAAPPTAPPVAPAVATASSARATPAAGAKTAVQQPSHEMDLDKLFEGEEPLELFDETADQLDKLPDSLAPISDESGALAEPTGTPAAPAPAAPTVAAPAPLRTLTADPASAAPKPAATTTAPIPPFAGAAPPRRPGIKAFSGLRGVKPTEVFSQTAFPPLDESAFKPQPIEGAADETAAPAPGHVPTTSGAAPLESLAAAMKKPGQPTPTPVAPPASAEPPGRRPWWRNLRVLLPLLILLLAAAAFAIIWFFPPKTLVQGTLQIKGADRTTADVWARHEQVTEVRNVIKDPGVQTDVLSNLQSNGIAPGFVQDAKAFVALADPSNSAFDNGRLVLKRPLADPQDSQRMQAILEVIYLRNQTRAEQASQAPRRASDATQQVASLEESLKAQQARVKALSDELTVKSGAAAASLLVNPQTAVDTLRKQGADLQKAIDQANAEVRRQHNAWEKAQAASQNAVVDPKILQIRQDLATLNARLSVAQVARSGQVDPVKAFDDAVQQVGDDLTPIVTVTAGAKDSPLAAYAIAARGAATETRSLIAQEKQDADQIAILRQQLAEHREAHLRQVWEADEKLKELLQSRDMLAHRYSVASDSGYAEDARRIQGMLEHLDQQIEDRRQTLATTGESSDETQQKLERTIEGLENERQQNATKIADAMTKLEIPSTTKISAGENAILVELAKNVASAQAQHEEYAANLAGKRPAGDADAEVQKLQSTISEKQAQLDAYQQRPDAPAQVAAARQALDAAQEAQARAQQALADDFDQLRVARDLRDAQAKANGIQNELNAQQEAQGKVAQAAAVPVILPPDPTAVQVVRDEDPRVTYLAAALGLILAVFAIPLWLATRAPEEDIPYAQLMTEPREAFGQRGEDLEGEDVLPDEEQAAFT